MDPKEIEKLAKVLRNQGDKLLTSEFKFTLTGEILRALNDSFSLIVDENEIIPPQTFQVTKPNNSKSNVFRELMFIYDFIQKTLVLKLTKFIDDDTLDESPTDISKFRNLATLEIQRVAISNVLGLQQLRPQLQEIVAEKCVKCVKDLIVHCGGDKANGFVWNSLKRLNLSYNNLESVDSSFGLEFVPYLQKLNLSHNKISHVSALVFLPNLKYLDLSYNHLTNIPKFHVEACRRLQVLILRDNLIDDISGLVRLDSLIELDLSGNCLLDHAMLLPLCTLNGLLYLNLSGNPLAFHPRHREATCRYLSRNSSKVVFQLDNDLLTKFEKSLTGCYENYYPAFGHRMQVPNSNRSSSNIHTPATKSISNTPDNTSLSSNSSLILNGSNVNVSGQKKIKPRDAVIEESGKRTEVKSPAHERRLLKEGSKDHLATKREIEQLRAQYGSDWLISSQEIAGYENSRSESSRRRLELEDILAPSPGFTSEEPLDSSTPIFDLGCNENDQTLYQSVVEEESNENSVYKSANDETFMSEKHEIVISDPEDDEETFIVKNVTTNQDLFLIITDNLIKERDSMTCETLTKWDFSTLQSVERPKSNIIHLSFNIQRKDKKERIFEINADDCQKLQKMLRDKLSSRPLSEMNQSVFKCLKCNVEFCQEIDKRHVICPNCFSKFIIEIQKSNKCSPGKSLSEAALSSLSAIQKPLRIDDKKERDERAQSEQSFSSIESCDSNQSVAGSSVEVLSESSSQVSHASQSSIEVIQPFRKPSEERRVSTAPSFQAISDSNVAEVDEINQLIPEKEIDLEPEKPRAVMSIANVNLTESSSSGSGVESVCTAYEQNGKKKVSVEPKSALEGIFKTSSFLLSKTILKKETESVVNQPSAPMQFNYDDLSKVDHRLKLFIFQNILEDNDEKFMWIVKCITIEEDVNCAPNLSLLAMSTKKIYVLRIVGDESEDISTWIKKSNASNFIGQIEKIKEIPYECGFSFIMKSSVNFHVLLRDSSLFYVLQKHITTSNQTLEIEKIPEESFNKDVEKITNQTKLQYLSIFKTCTTSIGSASNEEMAPLKNIEVGALLVTSEAIHLSTNFQWLCEANAAEKVNDKNFILTQPMINLIELEDLTKTSFTFSFMDEQANTIEKWNFTFDSYLQIVKILEIVNIFWSKIYSLPLVSEDQLS